MFESDSNGKSRSDDGIEVEKRTRRALERAATVLHTDGTPIEDGDDPSMVAVSSGNSGREHTVDLREDRCTCEDHRHRGKECYHLRRARIALGVRPVATAELAAVDVDEHLGATAPGPVVATSDGGMVNGGEDAAIIDGEDRDDGRPDDCDCLPTFEELPCFACYQAGFEEPAGGESDEDDVDGDEEVTGTDTPARSEPADFGGGESTGVQDL